jgi:hypothetical protein
MCTGKVTAMARFVLIDLEVIGDDLELVARHLENFVVVNAHKNGTEK